MPIQLLINPVPDAERTKAQKEMCSGKVAMGADTLRDMVKKAFAGGERSYRFVFRGAHPLQAGISYYDRFHALVKEYNRNLAPVEFVLQTPEDVLSGKWLQLFAKHGYLVRVLAREAEGAGKTAEFLGKNEISFEMIHVVDGAAALQADDIYRHYRKFGIKGQRYVPDQERICQAVRREEAVRYYGHFLGRVFDLWYGDVKRGAAVHNYVFENWLSIIAGICPDGRSLPDRDLLRFAVEADGQVRDADAPAECAGMGNIAQIDLAGAPGRRSIRSLMQGEREIMPACKNCCWNFICFGDFDIYGETCEEFCRRKETFCEAYREFFEYTWSRLNELAWYLAGRKR